jgi:hypothetical protein
MSFRIASRRLITSTTRLSPPAPTQRIAALSGQLVTRSSLVVRTMATQIPKSMEGVVINKTGGTEVLEYKTDLPVPTPKEGEILVKNEFTGINYIDT